MMNYINNETFFTKYVTKKCWFIICSFFIILQTCTINRLFGQSRLRVVFNTKIVLTCASLELAQPKTKGCCVQYDIVVDGQTMFSRQRILHDKPYISDSLNIETLARPSKTNSKVQVKLSSCNNPDYNYITKSHAGEFEHNRIIVEELCVGEQPTHMIFKKH